MREFKFRAWDGKEMYYDVFIKMNQVYQHFNDNFKTEVLLWVHDRCGHTTVYEKGWVMQWTGLKDKNGKDIYEGDIIKLSDGRIGSVEFHDGSFNIYGKTGCQSDGYMDEVWHYTFNEMWCEIIGNIFQNPELLKEE